MAEAIESELQNAFTRQALGKNFLCFLSVIDFFEKL
jgi:hypothetical protein